MLRAITATIVLDHVPPDDVPLTLQVGDRVRLGEVHPLRPDYVWAEDGMISAGWVPADILENRGGYHCARIAYCSAELAVSEGETVRLLWQDADHDAWWCESACSERGWLPAGNLRIDEQDA